jgi:hypothetical protein
MHSPTAFLHDVGARVEFESKVCELKRTLALLTENRLSVRLWYLGNMS